MKHKILAGVVLLSCGCTSTRSGVHSIEAVEVRQTVDSASFSAREAACSASKAKFSLMAAAHETSALLKAATPAQRTQFRKLKATLDDTQGELDSTLTQLNATNGALAESATRVDALQLRINAMGAELATAQDAEHAEKTRADFWRGAALKLGILSLALGVWTFRKPIAALMGVPI